MHMNNSSTRQSFADALDALVEQLKLDRSILAVILCGSLSHDTVWEKSDIDLALITIDDKKVPSSHIALYANGINVHAFLVPRTTFRQTMEGALHNSFMHSLLAKGRLLYSHDSSIGELCERLKEIGERDTRIQILNAASSALPPLYKAHKWFLTRGDLDYTALWILYTATPLARVEILSRRLLADREVLPQALKLNPEFFKTVYTDLLNNKKTAKKVKAALDAVDEYLASRASKLFKPVLEHLREVGEARSCTEIEDYFERNLGVTSAVTACEYLADQGLIGKASTSRQLTRKSNTTIQELAFYSLEEPD
jgi:predicted nucleotidyltransferase